MARRRRADESEAGPTCDCFLCGRKFAFGRNAYHGRYVRAWDVMICSGCESGNWDGVVIHAHPQLVERIKALGMPVTPNARGHIDIPSN